MMKGELSDMDKSIKRMKSTIRLLYFLIAIVVILDLFFIYEASKPPTPLYLLDDGKNLSKQEIQIFNAQFTSFEGRKVRGGNVKQLIKKIITNNIQNSEFKEKVVSIETNEIIVDEFDYKPENLDLSEYELDDNKIEDFEIAASKLFKTIKTGLYYEVIFETNLETGMINKVIITQINN